MTQLSSPPPTAGHSVRSGRKTKLLPPFGQLDPLMGLGGVLVAMVIIGAFVVSFEVLRDLARSYGIPGSVGWYWPVIVDGTIAAATVVLYAGRNLDRQAKLLPIFTLILFVLVSVAGNVMHNLLTDNVEAFAAWFIPIRIFVSAVPPIGLLLSVELFMTLHRIRATRKDSKARSVEIAGGSVAAWTPVKVPATVESAAAPVTVVTATLDEPVKGVTASAPARDHLPDVVPYAPVTTVPVAEAAPAIDGALPQLPEPGVAPSLHAVDSVPREPSEQVEWIVARARDGRDISKRTLLQIFEDAGQPVSDSTAQRRLREARQKAPEVFAA